MSNWILSVAGICLVSVVIDLVLPEGKLNEHIKRAVSYVVILVVIIPLPKLIKSDFDATALFQNINVNIQEDYIFNLNQYKINSLKTEIDNALLEKEILGANVSISANIFDVNMEIDAVYVDLYNVVITEKLKNINIKTEVESVVLNILEISKDKVFVYE